MATINENVKAWVVANSTGVLGYMAFIEQLAQEKAHAVLSMRGDSDYEKGEYAGMSNIVRLTKSIIKSGTENDT